MSGFNVDLLFRKVAKDLYVEDLDRLRKNGDADINNENRENSRILKLTAAAQKRFIPRTRNMCKCS